MTAVEIKEMRINTGMSQKEFADAYNIPVSTLRKWEQGESKPPEYVTRLIAMTLPGLDPALKEITGRDGLKYYYDRLKNQLSDSRGNSIAVSKDIEEVKEKNLGLYVSDLFEDFYDIQEKFNRDCSYDKKEDIIWI